MMITVMNTVGWNKVKAPLWEIKCAETVGSQTGATSQAKINFAPLTGYNKWDAGSILEIYELIFS